MGLVLYIHVEFKLDNHWHHWTHCSLHVDYNVFEKMTSLSDNNSIPKPKGFPDDITVLSSFDFDIANLKNNTAYWLSPYEIKLLENWLLEINPSPDRLNLSRKLGWLFGNHYCDFAENPESYPGLEDIRWVFWFDN